MENKLDFSLPEKKEKKSCTSFLVIILLLAVIGLILANIFIRPSGTGLLAGNTPAILPPEQMKELAAKLAQRNLYAQAASSWKEYLANAKLTDIEQAKGLFQIASLYEKANMYEEAVEYFYRSEMTAKVTELESQINAHIKDCFEKLGKFSALRYELMDRTSFKKTEGAGSEVVAEIGLEKITQADLDALIEQAIDIQLAPLMSFMTSERRNEQKKQLLEQYKAPSAKTQFLQSWLAQEVLYRDALEQELTEKPEVKREIEEMTRQVLSQQLMNKELADKINITETDLQTYYQANREKYVEPAKADDPNSVPRQKSFAEAREQVTSELISSKSRDVQQAYIKQLMDKYNIIVHTSVLNPTIQDSNDK
ncbi:MAG: hypothetical protein JW787_08380 [Sedimentisphaerales bacterium]|nr:hypothetical protein [Sedimentisphaerales bacterium]